MRNMCLRKNEKWNHTKVLKPNTNKAHSCRLPWLCPGQPLEQAKSSRQQGHRGKPQHCRFITSVCLSLPLESQFQPLRRRTRWRRREGGREAEGDSGVSGEGAIRHQCSSSMPAGQNALAVPLWHRVYGSEVGAKMVETEWEGGW